MDLIARHCCSAPHCACGLAAHPLYDNYVVTVGAAVNGSYGEITYSEDRYSGNFLPSIARDVYSITNSLSAELDNQVRQMAAREGLNFIYGDLYGEANVTLQPNGAGYLTTRYRGSTTSGGLREPRDTAPLVQPAR